MGLVGGRGGGGVGLGYTFASSERRRLEESLLLEAHEYRATTPQGTQAVDASNNKRQRENDATVDYCIITTKLPAPSCYFNDAMETLWNIPSQGNTD